MVQRVLYVDSLRGQDQQDGLTADRPLKTLTAALRRSQPETQIQLQAGTYSTASGERFPLVIPPGCEVIGQPDRDRPATVIAGSGSLQTPSLGLQAVTCVLMGDASLQTVTLQNPDPQGSGLWLGEGRVRLRGLVVADCRQYGGVVVGQALPTIVDSRFERCGTAGVAVFAQGKGHLERVTCQDNGTGLLLRDSAAPLLQNCDITRNGTGIAIADMAYPILRRNRIVQNRTAGITLTDQGMADLGQAEDPGTNVVRDNGPVDIQNRTSRSLLTCGNDLLPQRLQGNIQLLASTLPDPVAVPPMLFDQPATLPSTDPAESAPEEATWLLGKSRFPDVQGHWAAPFIDALAAAGAIAGFEDGTFRPDQAVTRAQFAAFALASLPDRPDRFAPVAFRDLTRSFWAWNVLNQAQIKGFLSGYPDGTVRPNDPMTRIQAIVAVVGGLALTGGRADDLGIYRDRAQVPSYAVDALATATLQRLVVNYPDALVLRPLEPITRAEVAALMHQSRVAMGDATAVNSPYIVRPDTRQPLFSDLSQHWAADFIRGLATAQLVSGMADGSFAPDHPMNRAQFATLIVKAFQPAPERSASIFQDVSPTFWAADAIQVAYRGGFVSGFPDQTFGPDNPLLRVQIWVALVNGLDWADDPVDLNPLGRFTDYDAIPRYALRLTAIAQARHLLVNYPDRDRLRPNQVATRAEVSAMVYQAMVALQRLPAIASPYRV